MSDLQFGTFCIVLLGGLANTLAVGCKSSLDADAISEPATTAQATEGGVSTSGVLCDLADAGNQRLLYVHGRPGITKTPIDETLAYKFAWTCDAAKRRLSGNGVPNHGVKGGEFASKVAPQDIFQTFPIAPTLATGITQIKEPGYALNSIKFDPGTAGTCPDTATLDTDCDYGRGRDSWRMVATPGNTSPWKFGFGVDENDAHVQPNGQYHYHGTPTELLRKLNPNYATSMTLVGWAMDGFPIYSARGYAKPTDAQSGVVELRSSYQLVAKPAQGRPSVDDFPLGHFMKDWVYVDNSGDLDECNGRFGVTPEFPRGTYHYHLTNTYPFVQRCVKGAGVTARRGPPPGGPPPGGPLPGGPPPGGSPPGG